MARVIGWSINSIATGMMPAAMISLTVRDASSALLNTASIVRNARGVFISRTNTFVITPNIPSEPITAPRKS